MPSKKMTDAEALTQMSKIIETGDCDPDCDPGDCVTGSFVALLNVGKELRAHKVKGTQPTAASANAAVLSGTQKLGSALKVTGVSGAHPLGKDLVVQLMSQLNDYVAKNNTKLVDLFWSRTD